MATIKGTKANDTRNGTSGKDTINGLQGNDTLSGLDGADAINGNDGNDTLIGGGGADALTGGAGADTFKYFSFDESKAGSGFGIDTIRDFNAAVDVADLTALGEATLKSSYDSTFSGLQAVFAYNAGTNITTLSYYYGSSTAVFQVKFTGNVSYSETAFLGIVEGAPPPTPPSLSIDDVTVNEAAGTITFTVTRSGDLSGASSVGYNTGDDSALDGSDYTAASGTVDFASGEATQTITISITNDDDVEDPETFTVTLSNPTGATISDSEGVGTINSDDVAPPPGPTEGDDNLTGTAGVDTVDLLGGNDTYNGLGGNDNIAGGTGNDTINGGDDSDVVAGNDGNDTINGGAGDDFLYGDNGNDTMNGGAGDDILEGGAGGDTLIGGSNGTLFFGDTFNYDATTDSPYVLGFPFGSFNAAYDDIIDFEHGPDIFTGDKIRLEDIDSDGNMANGDTDFTFVPLGGTLDTVHGSVQILPPSGGSNDFYSVVVYLAGDTTPDMVIMVHSAVALTSTDILL